MKKREIIKHEFNTRPVGVKILLVGTDLNLEAVVSNLYLLTTHQVG